MSRGSRLLIKEQFARRRQQGDFEEGLGALEHFAVSLLNGFDVTKFEFSIMSGEVPGSIYMSLRNGRRFDLNISCSLLEHLDIYVAIISYKGKKDFNRTQMVFGEDDLDLLKEFGEKMWKST